MLGVIEEAVPVPAGARPPEQQAPEKLASAPRAREKQPAAPPPQPAPLPAPAAPQTPVPTQAPAQTAPHDGDRVTPVARRMAQEQGIDPGQVPGTGPGGRVTRQDVEAFLEKSKQQPAPARPVATPPASAPEPEERRVVDTREERVRMSRRRRTIAERLLEASQTTAMLTTFNEIDMTAVMEMRRRRRDSFKERYGVGLGITSFFVKASIGALKAFPALNAEIQGDEVVFKHYYDIGVAVGASEGLVVPVLRDADRMSFAEIEKAIKEFAQKTESGTLSVADLRGGTFTITNGGVFGSLLSTPILNVPQVGILGLHKVEDRPMAVNGQVLVRPMMYVALSYDHRIVDGREAVQFLVRIKQLVEDPETLLLEG